MALLNLGDDPWLREHESCQKLQTDIMEQLTQRQREPKSSEAYARISAAIRIRLKQYNNEVEQLRDKLSQASRSLSITPEEAERRNRQVEWLQSKWVLMRKLFDDQTFKNNDRDRSRLLDSDEWGTSRGKESGIDPNRFSTEQLRDNQRRMIEEQESGLQNLSQIIARQKTIAETITSEVDLQNDIIDDLGDHIERTDTRLSSETKHINVVDQKDKTCIYWVIIVILFVAIISVVAI